MSNMRNKIFGGGGAWQTPEGLTPDWPMRSTFFSFTFYCPISQTPTQFIWFALQKKVSYIILFKNF